MNIEKIITNKWEISNLRNQQTTQMKWLKTYKILVAGCEAHVGTWVKMNSIWITLCKCKRLCIYFWVQETGVKYEYNQIFVKILKVQSFIHFFLLSHSNDSKGSWVKKQYYLWCLFFFEMCQRQSLCVPLERMVILHKFNNIEYQK